ncbi:hypothetical protein VKT23_016953 [Stygiomarasmius scandens]|uniref:Uncharacterized protein n=1 Tax=Marasmiellus scandens TaxID=2682957 RepID=A0ABR1ITH3_9AGAR
MQCIARASQRMAITQLETVTLAFASLNFVTYGLWWNKPLGVECPVSVCRNPEQIGSATGVQNIDSRVSDVVAAVIQSLQDFLSFPPNRIDVDSFPSLGHYVNHILGLGLVGHLVMGLDDAGVENLDPRQLRDDSSSSPSAVANNYSRTKNIILTFAETGADNLDLHRSRDLSAAFAVDNNSQTSNAATLRVPTFYSGWHKNSTDIFYFTSFKNMMSSPALLALPIAAAFGSIHCIAWSAVFATDIEQRLWHISSIVMFTSPLLPFLCLLDLRYIWLPSLSSLLSRSFSRLIILLVRLALLSYIAARLYIIVEAFISLRALPSSAYRTVRWTSFLPHV